MPLAKTRADYDQLSAIAGRFGQEFEAIQQLIGALRAQIDTLHGGDWIGQGATAFYAEMDSQVMPSLMRLARALASAQRVTLQIRSEVKAAEDAAAAVLKYEGQAGGAAAKPGGGFLSQVGGFFGGLWDGASGMVGGLWQMVTHPIDTVKGLAYGVTHPAQLWDALKKPYVDDWQSGNYGRAIGRGTFEAVMLLVPGAGEAGAVGKGSEVANVAGKLAEASEAANVVAKGERVAEAANAAAKAEEVANAASKAGTVAETSAATQAAFKTLMGSKYDALASDAGAIKAAHPELANIPTPELAAVRGYTTADYSMLNSALRTQDAAELTRLKPYLDSAVAGMEKLPNYEGTVYRGTSLSPDILAKYVPGQTVVEDAFTSTSKTLQASFDGNTKFVIQSLQGKDVSLLSKYPGEQEILFRPGSPFKVLSNSTDASGQTTIFLKEIPGASLP